MKHTNSTNTRPALSDVENDRASLSLELRDMLNHGSHPELFDQVLAGLFGHSLIRMTDANRSANADQVVQFLRDTDTESLEHREWINDSIERLRRAVKPRAGCRPTAERLSLRCPCCHEVLKGSRRVDLLDIARCPKCGAIQGDDTAAASPVEVPTVAPRLFLVRPIRDRETIQ